MMDDAAVSDFFDFNVSKYRNKNVSAKYGIDMKAVRLWEVIRAAREIPPRIILFFQIA